jgi:hypothetical protein
MNFNAAIMYGPNFQPNFDVPVDPQRWYDQLPINFPIPYAAPQRVLEDLQRDIDTLTQRVTYLESVLTGDGK